MDSTGTNTLRVGSAGNEWVDALKMNDPLRAGMV